MKIERGTIAAKIDDPYPLLYTEMRKAEVENMANEEHLKTIQQGKSVWNKWREKHPKVAPDLSYASLSGVVLSGVVLSRTNLNCVKLSNANLSFAIFREATLSNANFSNANLNNANFEGANLSRANFEDANLSGANFSNADLSSANFSSADLSGVDFGGADLNWANFIFAHLVRADLSGANFTDVNIGWTTLGDLDLRKVEGLESIKHIGPSTIGIDTFIQSKGDIPPSFLKKAGIPDEWIEYTKSLVGRAIEYSTCFISYSSQDQAFAERLYADLQNKGVQCWYAPEDMKIGDKIRPRIDESIRLYDKLLLVLSEHSIGSKWVEHEVEMALAKERDKKQMVLFPVRLDQAVMEMKQDGWPTEVRHTRHIELPPV
ncbi:hypothetical protein KSF_089290 [Reticulibacter mediterranei]|uniref:TIR domain-containing protein n=1 Tax=Reticulibacter mediterranei TaxID=2778369 RepID=A0A8J3IZK5_9CHLR|nr:toll/interleukin-1 receptor domain-containing protein [Reticulibacter mediterranei]GHO98881.1 hypothetical protein KSF_089290 [Reticulibacter mediterranei]